MYNCLIPAAEAYIEQLRLFYPREERGGRTYHPPLLPAPFKGLDYRDHDLPPPVAEALELQAQLQLISGLSRQVAGLWEKVQL